MTIVYRRYRDRMIADIAKSTDSWQYRHNRAILAKDIHPLAGMIHNWLYYAEQYKEQNEDGIGTDTALGPAWAIIGASLRGLLNGELGPFDGGTLDGAIADTLMDEGYDPDTL